MIPFGSRARRHLLTTAIAAVAAFAVAACGSTKDDSSSSSSAAQSSSTGASANAEAPIKKGLKVVSIPKQLGNPYEEFEHSGVVEAMKELGGS